jgi:hypothetical protein
MKLDFLPKKFCGSKNCRTFAASINRKGDEIRLSVAGFFYAPTQTYTALLPWGTVIEPQPLRAIDSGLVTPFSVTRFFLKIMSIAKKNASRAKHSTAASTPAERNTVSRTFVRQDASTVCRMDGMVCHTRCFRKGGRS